MYAHKLGITHVAKKDMPAEWLAECVQDPTEIKEKINFFK